MVDDFIDKLLMLFLLLSSAGLLFIIGAVIYDAGNNGVNDCSDDPKYCVTPQELHREWPQFNG